MKVAWHVVPGKVAMGEPSRRVRSDGLRFRIYNLAKGGWVDPKKIRAYEGDVTVSTTNHTVPYGTCRTFQEWSRSGKKNECQSAM